MRGSAHPNFNPRIVNRRAMHEFFIAAKIECGIVLLGSEVKSLRLGRCQLQESFARVEGGQCTPPACQINPYEKAPSGPEPLRERKLLAHRREIRRLENETAERGTTLI